MNIKTRKRVPYVTQMQQTECGLCCCAMLLRYYKSNESLSELREFLEVGRDGLTIRQLSVLMMHRGFDAPIYKGTIKGLRKLHLPLIAYWKNEHFVVVEKIHKNTFHIVDPAIGRKKISEEEFEKDFSEYILCAYPSDAFVPKKEKRKSVWVDVLSNLFDRKLLFLITLLLSIASYMLTLRIPLLVQKLIDHVVIEKTDSSINQFALATLIIMILYGMFVLIRGIKFISLNLFLSKRLVADTFLHLLNLPYKFFDLRSSGDLLYRIGSLNGIRELISSQLVGGMIDFGAIVFIAGYMLMKSIPLTVVAVTIFIANMIFMIVTRRAISESIDNEIVEQSKSQAIQVEALFSIASIKVSGMEDEIYSSWDNSFKEVLDRFKKRSALQNIYHTITGTIQMIAPLIILIAGLFLYIDHQLTLGETIAFQSMSITFFGLSTSLFGAYTQYLLATSYLERVADITNAEPEPKPIHPVDHKITGDVRLEQVSFSYTKHSAEVIKNISLHIKRGQKVAIVGASGSGKSTLSKILVGLYSPTQGEVFYDGIPMKSFDKKALCKQMGIVPQDIMLFNKSIFKNIVMNKEDMDIERVKSVAVAAQIADEIEKMPMRYYTVVSEMGMNLSGGQRQRIALARALLSDPKIIILDEATSSLDFINETKISDYLSHMGCTRIVIAHRLSTIIDSDVIFVMEDGAIVEQGSHDTLMRMQGIYYRLYSSAFVEAST